MKMENQWMLITKSPIDGKVKMEEMKREEEKNQDGHKQIDGKEKKLIRMIDLPVDFVRWHICSFLFRCFVKSLANVQRNLKLRTKGNKELQ